jgi:proteasome lid subunit RPN8/RPN11
MSSLTPRLVRAAGRTLTMPVRELERLHDHAIAGFPQEVMGILAGRQDQAAVTRVVPLENIAPTDAARRDQVDGPTRRRAEKALEADGLDVLGYYHSHRDHPAMYSDSDRDQALLATSYVIAAVQGAASDGTPTRVVDVRAWRLSDDRSEMLSEELVVLPNH